MTSQSEHNPFNFQKTVLDNGLRIVTCSMQHTRSVSISIFIGVGSRYESEEQAGISHFNEHMVFKGTNRRSQPGQISAIIEATGGVLNAATEQEMTVFWCKVAESHFQESLDLLIDMVRDPILDPEGIEMERMVVLDELSLMNDNPSSKVDTLTDQMLWPNHPLGRDIGGTKKSVSGLTRDMLLEHVSSYYSPSNAVVSVAGNISHQQVVQELEVLCEGWGASIMPSSIPFTHAQLAPQVEVEYRKTEQAHLSIAVPGLPLDHSDQYALDLISVLLGEGMSSRLFSELREKLGLAYDIHSGVFHFLDCGAFVISAGIDPMKIYDAVQVILEQQVLMILNCIRRLIKIF